MSDDTIQQLQDAVRISPGNQPLRRMLAGQLLAAGRHDEAETEFRVLHRQDPQDAQAAFGLARTFAASGRVAEALVVVEDLCGRPDAPAAAHALLAELRTRRGEAPAEPPAELRQRAGPVLGTDAIAGDRPERPRLTFADIGGMEAVKETIRLKIIYPVTRPEIYRAYGKKAGGGIMLYGPPGCGKTHLARAVAGELGAGFLAIGINDVLEMWIGASEKNLHALFENARANRPCVLFVDEVDALAASRSDMRASAGRQVINQFLAELDGIDGDNEGLLVLAATNAPWHVDGAFRRPGRFDQVVFVPPPDPAAREAILRIHLEGRPATAIDHAGVAKRTDGFSGADLKAVVDRAIEIRLTEALRSGVPQPITTKDLLAAAKLQKPTCQEWFASARNHALYANQGGLYDEVLTHLGLRR